MASSLHLNASLISSLDLECNVSSASLLTNLCWPKLEMADGTIAVPDGPGLGVTVDEEMVARYRIA